MVRRNSGKSEKKRKENRIVYLIQLSRLSSLAGICKGEALVHTSWYHNPFLAEEELKNNKNVLEGRKLRGKY